MEQHRTLTSDVLVIGGGIAGLFAAITAADEGQSVVLTDKNYAGKSGASIMGSGQLNVFNPDWGMDFDRCMARIVRTGEYLNNRAWLEAMMRESWGIYESLRDWGVEFPSSEENFRSYMNSVHDWQQATDGEAAAANAPEWGMVPLKHREIPPKLRAHALRRGVRIADRVMTTELTVADGRATGALGFDIESGEPVIFRAKAVVMAAGKNGFRAPGMNIAELTGDADAMAFRAGADISGKEFPDLHITVEREPVWKSTGEIYPAYWNFTDGEGEPVQMRGFDLSMASVVHAGRGPVVWDFEHMTDADRDKIENYIAKRHMPHETKRVHLGYHDRRNEIMAGGAAAGSPAEQSAGIWPVDLSCASTLPGLYSAGDCCCTWSWGAINAGAPPGLLPAGVTGRHAGRGAALYANSAPDAPEADVSGRVAHMLSPLGRRSGYDPRWVCQLLQNAMLPYYVIHIKRADRLEAALTNVLFYKNHMAPRLRAADAHELRLCHETENMILNAEMILRASLMREESRGWHYREDFPARDDARWLAWVRMREGAHGMETERTPMPPDMLENDPASDRYDPRWLAWEQ